MTIPASILVEPDSKVGHSSPQQGFPNRQRQVQNGLGQCKTPGWEELQAIQRDGLELNQTDRHIK